MKRTLSILLALMLLTCCAGAAAEVKVNVPADYAWPAIGTADSPVEIKVVIKDYYADSNENIELFSRISAAMAAHGQYVKLTLIDPPVGTSASTLPMPPAAAPHHGPSRNAPSSKNASPVWI